MTSLGPRLAIVGDFNPDFVPHTKTNDAIAHAGDHLGLPVAVDWIPSAELAGQAGARLSDYDGVWVAPGSPYRSMEGALEAIRFSREQGLPLLGTCGGCQYALIEYARNVLGVADAQHAEHDPYASVLVITPLSCSLVGQRMDVFVEQGSLAARAYAGTRATEEYYCNFGLNPDYEARLHEGGLQIIGRDANREPRILTIPAHPFFLATVFVPQLRSSPAQPHPLIVAFLRAIASRAAGRTKEGRVSSSVPAAASPG